MSGGKTRTAKVLKAIEAVKRSDMPAEEKACAVLTMTRFLEQRDNCVKWHKVTTRQLTDEERKYYEEQDLCPEFIFTCEMPEDGQEILVATPWGVHTDACDYDSDYGIGLDICGDWESVLAWAEVPKYEEG